MARTIIAALLVLLAGPATAAESAVLVIDGRPANEAIALLGRLTGQNHSLAPGDAVIGLADRPVRLVLAGASPSAVRQALAHALACWWARSADGIVIYQRGAVLPLGPLSSRTISSGLPGTVANERRLCQLLAPWLGDRRTGLAAVDDGSLWAATLDADGHARLVETLGVLERGEPRCPPLIGDPEAVDPDRRMAHRVAALEWPAYIVALADATGLSISCAPGIEAGKPPALDACRLGDIPARLGERGVPAAIVHGVICLGTAASEEREHPALRRRLALLPVRHLVRDDVEATLLVEDLRRHVAPQWWPQPAAALQYLPVPAALLVAADPATVHAVLDALDLVDLLGLEAGLAALADRQRTTRDPR
ncbi:MAG: hypothetical protein H0W72_00660 [Planctomycetes bacterium]|nr:hypothetical protein [Planctomycetota bacterium]